MKKLNAIHGIGETYAARLGAIGINSIEELLDAGATSKGRKTLESSSGVSGKLLLRWVNMADLFRINGIGQEYADLLEAAGVDTVPELAQRNAANLHQRMRDLNDSKQLVKAAPSLPAVTKWIEQAKALPRKVSH